MKMKIQWDTTSHSLGWLANIRMRERQTDRKKERKKEKERKRKKGRKKERKGERSKEENKYWKGFGEIETLAHC